MRSLLSLALAVVAIVALALPAQAQYHRNSNFVFRSRIVTPFFPTVVVAAPIVTQQVIQPAVEVEAAPLVLQSAFVPFVTFSPVAFIVDRVFAHNVHRNVGNRNVRRRR